MSLLAAVVVSLAFQQAPDLTKLPEFVQSKRSIDYHGSRLSYTATTGTLPIRDNDQNEEVRMFYAAYTKDGTDPTSRPIVFAFNGGPGSATLWLHMGSFGPRRAELNPDGSMPAAPFKLVDNQETWLNSADIVFIDAPGAGFSRLSKPDAAKKYYNVRGDAQAFTEFIRMYLNRNKRWQSPLFLAGESYGGMRIGVLSKTLLDNGIALNGVIIISGTLNFASLDAARGNDLPYITYLPTYFATAYYHKKLSPRLMGDFNKSLAEVEAFANGEYAAALHRGDALSQAEKENIAGKVAEYAGLSKEFVMNCHLRVSDGRFYKELLRKEGKTVGRLDGRLTGTDALEIGDSPETDPSSDAITPAIVSCLNDYYSRELGYVTDQKYFVYKPGGGWEFGGGIPDTSEDFRACLAQNPHMKVMICCGYTDMACTYSGIRYTMDHSDLPAAARNAIEWQYYMAGHMMYIDTPSRIKMAKDAESFIKRATAR
jgi:carboxypeptidase C (cathepsin A)